MIVQDGHHEDLGRPEKLKINNNKNLLLINSLFHTLKKSVESERVDNGAPDNAAFIWSFVIHGNLKEDL